MSHARAFTSTTVLADGTVLVAGGDRLTGGVSWVVGTSERFDPRTETWSAAGRLGVPRGYHGAAQLSDGSVLLVGGDGADDTALRSAERWDSVILSWSRTDGDLATGRLVPSATTLTSGKVLVAGGLTRTAGSAGEPVASAELFDPNTDRFTATGGMHHARFHHGVALLPSGRVLVAGGCDNPDCTSGTETAELYDPTSGVWTVAAPLPAARIGITLTVLRSGEVLAAGGCISNVWCTGETRSAYLWREQDDAWLPVGVMSTGHALHFAGLLPDGKVLVAAGDNPAGYGVAGELYDPATATWSATTNTWSFHGAGVVGAVLLDGRVILAGGLHVEEFAEDATREAELYEP
ncbi:MAG: kelch repeat-containing protein [Anaeromyxobacter sp.]